LQFFPPHVIGPVYISDIQSSPVGAPNTQKLHLNDLVQYYMKPEDLTGDNKYFCENCGNLQDAHVPYSGKARGISVNDSTLDDSLLQFLHVYVVVTSPPKLSSIIEFGSIDPSASPLLVDRPSFMKPEDLTGDNKYFCENCGNLQDAVRKIKLKQVPDNLIITLLRFSYDAKRHCLIHLSSPFHFHRLPEIFRMFRTQEKPEVYL
jgi:DNA-directed RNA polymerase subunit M/transcription elongation factor TFIIS